MSVKNTINLSRLPFHYVGMQFFEVLFSIFSAGNTSCFGERVLGTSCRNPVPAKLVVLNACIITIVILIISIVTVVLATSASCPVNWRLDDTTPLFQTSVGV